LIDHDTEDGRFRMILITPKLVKVKAELLKAMGRLLLLTIAMSFFLLIPGAVGAGEEYKVQDEIRLSALDENDEDESAGVLVKEFNFFRPFKLPESEDVGALKTRRRQLSAMVNSERNRLEKALERTQGNIEAHIKFLEKSLDQVDKEIIKEGDTLIPGRTLHGLTKEFRNRELTLEEMNEVADLVTMAYQEKGYILARAYVPEQEIEDGVLKIAIVEGDVDKIEVTGTRYYNKRVIRRNFMEQLRHGVIREDLLEKGLLMTKELPSAETRIVLKKGEKPGSANVALQTEDKFALDVNLDANNFGSELIGKERYGAKIEITDPWWGSTLSLRGVSGNDRNDSALDSVNLSVPINYYGTKVELKYLKGLYAVGQELADLGLEGDTKVYGISVSHPFLRTRNKNLTFTLGYDHKFSESTSMTEVQSIDELDTFYAVLDYDSLDRFLGKNIASFGYYTGSIRPDRFINPSRLNADLNYQRYTLNLARIQKIYGHINLMVRGSGQATSDMLVPMEQLPIGGYGTVRGHETSLFLGDYGFTLSAEVMSAPPYISNKVLFGQKISQLAQLAMFFDYGRVYNSDPQPGEYSSERLAGYGVGIRLYYKDMFSFKFDLGFPTREKTIGERGKFYYVMGSFNLTSDVLRPKLKKISDFWKK